MPSLVAYQPEREREKKKGERGGERERRIKERGGRERRGGKREKEGEIFRDHESPVYSYLPGFSKNKA